MTYNYKTNTYNFDVTCAILKNTVDRFFFETERTDNYFLFNRCNRIIKKKNGYHITFSKYKLTKYYSTTIYNSCIVVSNF